MNIIEPSVEVYFHIPEDWRDTAESEHPECHIDPVTFLELVGRTCYKSEDRITPDSSSKFVKMLYDRGHHAMLEHCVASVKFICDRGVTHELVRHRLVAYAQESTRYCNYSKSKFGGEISVIKPPELNAEQEQLWQSACLAAECMYMKLVESGVSPQIARAVLPTCLKTEIWATANLREWAHICKLRCAPAAHPQMRELMCKVKKIFAETIPEIFAKLSEHRVQVPL